MVMLPHQLRHVNIFEEFGVPVFFFQSFISKLENSRIIFLYAFITKSYNFLNQIFYSCFE